MEHGEHKTNHTTCNHLFWVDIETTSLEDDSQIMEIYMMVTDGELNELDSIECVIHHDKKELINKLSEWSLEHHSNLVDECDASLLTLSGAEQQLIELVKKYSSTPSSLAVVAGSSVFYDKQIIKRCMPLLYRMLHHQVVDVSTVMLLAKRWKPKLKKIAPKKNETHRAKQDVLSSLSLLRFYKSHFFTTSLIQ